MRRCQTCGKEYESGAFCADCGGQLEEVPEEPGSLRFGNTIGDISLSTGNVTNIYQVKDADIQDYEEFLSTAKEQLRLTLYEDALEYCDKASRLKPLFPEPYFCRAKVLQRMGRLEDSINSYAKALKMDPENVRGWEDRGHVLNRLGFYTDAAQSFSKALKYDPDNAMLWTHRGESFQNADRMDEALKCYEKALELDPDLKNDITHPTWSLYQEVKTRKSKWKVTKGSEKEEVIEPKKGPPTMFCNACGKEILKSAEICPGCGTRVRAAEERKRTIYAPDGRIITEQKSVALAVILSIFIPGLGTMYAGKVGWGLLLLILSWGLLAIFIGIFIWLYAILDANNVAEENNRIWRMNH